jgi:hypothetical protein
MTHEQVHATAADGVFALDGPVAVHDAVEKRHEHEVRRDFVVRRGAEQWLAVIPPEGEEGAEEAIGIEAAVGAQPRRREAGRESCIPAASARGITS